MGDETAAPPSSSHILYPNHIGLLSIFLLLFGKVPILERKAVLPLQFLLHVHRVLLVEVSETAQPRSLKEIISILRGGPTATLPIPSDFIRSVEKAISDLQTPDQMTAFFASIPPLFVDKGDDEDPPILKRSLFGFFCRRCYVSFVKLSFSGLSKLQQDFQSWTKGDQQAGFDVVRRDLLTSADLFMSKTRVDKKEWARPDAFKEFERAQAAGDTKSATESVRHFFEQRFNEGTDSGLRQHSLLNLVRMHYLNGEYESARKLLSEAISVARTKGDRILLQHCMSMYHRMPESPETMRLPINDIQPDLHPLEVLFDIKKLLDETYEQPLGASFKRVYESMGVFDLWCDSKANSDSESEQWAQHAVQAVVWNAAGCGELAAIEEDIVIGFTQKGIADNNRIYSILNKAYALARNGLYEKALVILMNPLTWRGLMLSDYNTWASTVWHVLVLRAARRGQHRQYREQLLPRRGAGSWSPRSYFNDRATSSFKAPMKILDPLYEVIQMRQTPGAPTALEPLLSTLWFTEFLGRLDLFRTTVIMLSDMSMEFGMSKYSQRLIADIMPQVINGGNVEQRALACFVLARCYILLRDTEGHMQIALQYLHRAEADYRQLEMYHQVQEVLYFISILYYNLGDQAERDRAAHRYMVMEKKQKEMEQAPFDSETQLVLDLVAIIGGAIATRRAN